MTQCPGLSELTRDIGVYRAFDIVPHVRIDGMTSTVRIARSEAQAPAKCTVNMDSDSVLACGLWLCGQ